MTTHSSPGEGAGYLNTAMRQAKLWLNCGRRMILEDKPLWFGMAAVYFALGLLLTQIPFMGDLLLILITPMLLAGVVWGRALEDAAPLEPTAVPTSPAVAAPRSVVQERVQTWVTRPAQELLRIFGHEEKMFAAILLGIVTLGLVMLVKITGYLLVGGSIMSALAASQTGLVQLTVMIGMALVAVLSVLLAMGLMFSVPFTVLGGRQPLAAISESFGACHRHAGPLLALIAPFFLIYLLIVSAFTKSVWLGYLLLVSVGLLALPWFVASMYCSYLMLFPPSPSDLRR